MNELLKSMYGSFHKPITAEKQNDAKDSIVEDSTMDSFFFGFRLGCQHAVELRISETAYLRYERKPPLNTPFSYPIDKPNT